MLFWKLKHKTATELIALIPGHLGYWARNNYYKKSLSHYGPRNKIYPFSVITNTKARMGSGVLINKFCVIGFAWLGDRVLVGDHVSVLGGRHPHPLTGPRYSSIPLEEGPVIIGDDVWIGTHSVVMANVGKGAVIAAGSIVLNDVPEHTLVGGNPAHIIRTLDVST